jgi:hypothetical protein
VKKYFEDDLFMNSYSFNLCECFSFASVFMPRAVDNLAKIAKGMPNFNNSSILLFFAIYINYCYFSYKTLY